MTNKWCVKKASIEDADRWFALTAIVQPDFYNIDLCHHEQHVAGMKKNMGRGTAIYIEESRKPGSNIIGALTYSTNQSHISWLAVHPDYRKLGVASALMEQVIQELADAEEIKVKTFLYDDDYGTAARSFYQKHGFVGGEIIMSQEGFPHPIQVFVRKRSY